eukprot:GHVU01013665.1.p1 GENE.GHVU01013665.1~~GHVU01013665.1.p1  ORF type:complete len:357 (-),score=70.72 GHVU01013665.1:12-1082(-)
MMLLQGSERFEEAGAHIGEGAYARVVQARDKVDGQEVAIKKQKMDMLIDADMAEVVGKYGIPFSIIRELKFAREIHHPNVISIKDAYVKGDFVCVAMPYLRTDLRKLLEKTKPFRRDEIKCLTQQIAMGLCALHEQYVTHRDLTPANILISSEGVCKICDFGLARSFAVPRQSVMTCNVVTLWYRPPELLFGARLYHDRVDIWSFGCIFAELLSDCKNGRRQALFPGDSEVNQLARIFRIRGTPNVQQQQQQQQTEGGQSGTPNQSPTAASAPAASCSSWPGVEKLRAYAEFTRADPKPLREIFPEVSEDALDLLDRALALDPRRRPTAAEILAHPYFTNAPLPCSPDEVAVALLS